jgi:hypothetical protein
MALVFIVAGVVGVAATIAALNSRAFRNLSENYRLGAPKEPDLALD